MKFKWVIEIEIIHSSSDSSSRVYTVLGEIYSDAALEALRVARSELSLYKKMHVIGSSCLEQEKYRLWRMVHLIERDKVLDGKI